MTAQLESGGWIHPPLPFTPDLYRAVTEHRVQVPFSQLPLSDQENYGVSPDDPEAETIYGYFYLTDSGSSDELAREHHHYANVCIELSERQTYFPLGGHTQGCSLREMAHSGRMYLISYADFCRIAAHTSPNAYLLDQLQVDRTQDDPYLRVTERLAFREDGQRHANALMRAARVRSRGKAA